MKVGMAMVTAAGAVLWLALGAHTADCREMRVAGAPPQRVELYTSEGCSSCPPADRWWSTAVDDDRLWLGFHVDYWDDLGWRDRYSDARYADRQREISVRTAPQRIYTPEVVLEGREYRGWRAGVPAAGGATGPVLTVELQGERPRYRLKAQLDGADANVRLYAAITEDGLHQRVLAGENRGRLLQHDRVVRAYAGPVSAGGDLELQVPQDLVAERARLLVWAEGPNGSTVQGLQRALPLCTAR